MSDEHEGMGGSYVLNPKTGKRTLVARTEPPAETEQTEKPADAGFFSPEQPAEPTNATE